MFYRIKENKLYDYADYRYNDECLETDIVTQSELQSHPNKVIVSDGVLVLNPNYEKEQQEQEKQRLILEIKQQLNNLDLKSIRALRSNDTEYIELYEQQAVELRNRLKELQRKEDEE